MEDREQAAISRLDGWHVEEELGLAKHMSSVTGYYIISEMECAWRISPDRRWHGERSRGRNAVVRSVLGRGIHTVTICTR